MTDIQRKQRALDAANAQAARILLADPALEPESLAGQWARSVLNQQRPALAQNLPSLPQ